MAHGTLGEELAGDVWVVGFDELALALGRFRQVPDEVAQRRWHDLSRILAGNRRTSRDKVRFVTREMFKLSQLGRLPLLGLGLAFGAGVPLLSGVTWWLLFHPYMSVTTWLIHWIIG